MKQKRFSEHQIIKIVKEGEAGQKVDDLCRRYGIGKSTYYYSNPSKYSVSDGFLHCSGLWGVRVDNNHDKYVIVYLGDLGRDLSYEEQLYWRSFNVILDGSISLVNYKRSFLAQPTDPERSDLLFKYRFQIFQEKWQKKFGWFLFKPLSEDDVHLYTALRLPLTNDQAEFDSQVLALTKTLVDSLNEKKLTENISVTLESNSRGITKFEKFLDEQSLQDYQSIINFFRNLQSLKSSGVGHRKSKNYDRIAAIFYINEKDLIVVFEDILKEAISILEILERGLI